MIDTLKNWREMPKHAVIHTDAFGTYYTNNKGEVVYIAITAPAIGA